MESLRQEAVPTAALGGNHAVSVGAVSPDGSSRVGERAVRTGKEPSKGLLIVNADDWGHDQECTDRTLECVLRGTVSSVSAMVFMTDSERAAAIAQERGIDAGLHLNLTTRFGAHSSGTRLLDHQQRLTRYLRGTRFSQVVFHPSLADSFKYVVTKQLDEFNRLYGTGPERIDGHHHMHLCANVVYAPLLPFGTILRPSSSFWAGEKNWCNRLYRRMMNRILARRHRVVDYFFSLLPLEPEGRLQRIFSSARRFVVEVGTHPADPEEYQFLAGGEIVRRLGDTRIASSFAMPERGGPDRGRPVPMWQRGK